MKEQIVKQYKENKKAFGFVLKLLGIYLLLQAFYDFIISPFTPIDSWLINSIISTAQNGLSLLGYDLLTTSGEYQYHMGIAGTSGVVIGNPCDGLSLFILYSAFVIVFSGKWWAKLIFILPGIALIHLLNVGRVISLALIVKYYPDSLDFHHSYTFTLLVYSFTFLFWMLRIKVFQKYKF